MGLLSLLLLIVVVGLIVWALITYVPMPQPFQGLVIIVALIAVLVIIFGDGGLGGGLHFGRLGCG